MKMSTETKASLLIMFEKLIQAQLEFYNSTCSIGYELTYEDILNYLEYAWKK